MTTLTLVTGGLLALASGVVYAYVGHRIGQRRVVGEAALPLGAFAIWWQSLAAITIITALATIAASFDWLDADLYVALSYFTLMLLSVGLGCLLHYLVFLFTGRLRWWRPIVAAYAAYLVFLIYVVRSHLPMGVERQRWQIAVHYERPLAGDPLFAWAVVLLIAPPLLSALAYGSLAYRVRERALRYRITVVAASILVWFGSALAASLSGYDNSDGWQLGSRLIGLAAALCILAGYYPPRPLRRRFGLVSIEEPVAASPRPTRPQR
ncbi:MAG: hypothetical protein ABR562_03865 [Thermoplasmatota archaeon]|nr:hypothetical protein [Halobacteriales archaeon]